VVLAVALATLVADSALNLLLIPRYGMTGAAAGTAATLCAAAAAVIVLERRRRS
jgi:O-antigen/teichoic acid export membrane protein